MRWHTVALLLFSLITLIFAKDEPLSQAMMSCEMLYQGARPLGDSDEDYDLMEVKQRTMGAGTVQLLWDDTLEHAAGALFRALFVSIGIHPEFIKMQWYPRNKGMPVTNLNTMTIRVFLAPKIHVRLTSRSAASPACYNVTSFYTDEKILRKCDFLVPGKENVFLYVPNEWNSALDLRDMIYWMYSPNTGFKMWKIKHIKHSHLTQLVHGSNHSFLFLDADLWSNTSSVRIMQCVSNSVFCSRHVNDTVRIRAYDENLHLPDPWPAFIEKFSPVMNVLRNVIEFATQYHSTIEESACECLVNKGYIQNLWRIEPSNKYFYKNYPRETIVIIICETERKDFDEYLYLTETMSAEKPIHLYSTNCQDTHWLQNNLLSWYKKDFVSYKTVVLTNDMATVVAPFAENYELPLLTYDTSETWIGPAARSATGRVAHLELWLRSLLADCGWRRLAIMSESTRLATALSAALRAPAAGLTVREVNVTSAPEIRNALQKLVAAGARVFLVNTDVAAAAVVLATAQELNITRDAGFAWIVREYDEADRATAATRPLSVSFRWRGDVADEASNSTLLTMLETRWRGRAWPLHAAPLADAILTFQGANMYRKSFKFLEKENIKVFWDSVQNTNISGIKQKLLYDGQGVSNPTVYVEEWGAAPRPRLLAKWHADQWRESSQCPMTDPPPSDGLVRCVVPTGDPFQPTCRDTILFLSVGSATLVSAMLIFLIIRYSHQALTARDQRIKVEVAERMLARRERVFAALAVHIVDRSMLELDQELGAGRFGVVRLGVLRKPGRTQKSTVVAAKALRDDASPGEETEFLREACTLAELDHEYVVRFIGVCVLDGPPLLLMEHASYGDLLHYLQSRRHVAEGAATADTSECTEFGFEEKAFVSAAALTRFAREAAAALAYLFQRGFVHRDVRAANCLVDERRSLKLADFGLARATGTIDGEYACRRRGLFPVLWMAPESLASGVSSSASDVWSFGVLVFELVTLGRRPYGSQPPPCVLRHILGGGQPQLPWDASAETLSLVRACWRLVPETRPTAAQLVEWLTARRSALRPALSAELVEIDGEVDGNNEFNDPDLDIISI